MPTRAEVLLGPVPRDGRIIEIGPSYNPIAPKSDGWNSFVIDHLTRDGLVAKYAAHGNVDTNRIEAVDFVWTRGMLSDAVPLEQHGSFDAFIASHVVEHTPDFIAFLDAAATLLKPSGVVILAIPDKRFCFDYFQPLTTTGQLLEAHVDRRSRHTARQAFDHFAYSVRNGGSIAWAQQPTQGIRFTHGMMDASRLFRTYQISSDYLDLHAWHFVPSSFELILLELARLGATDWRVERVTPTDGCEFFAWLRPGGGADAASLSVDDLDIRRMALLKRTLLESQTQLEWLLVSEPELASAQTILSKPVVPTMALALATTLAACQHQLAEVRSRLIAAEARCETASQRIAALEASTSWRATAPLRAVRRFQRKEK